MSRRYSTHPAIPGSPAGFPAVSSVPSSGETPIQLPQLHRRGWGRWPFARQVEGYLTAANLVLRNLAGLRRLRHAQWRRAILQLPRSTCSAFHKAVLIQRRIVRTVTNHGRPRIVRETGLQPSYPETSVRGQLLLQLLHQPVANVSRQAPLRSFPTRPAGVPTSSP